MNKDRTASGRDPFLNKTPVEGTIHSADSDTAVGEGRWLGSSTALRAEQESTGIWRLGTGNSRPGSTESRPTGFGGSVKKRPARLEPSGKGLATGLGPGAK